MTQFVEHPGSDWMVVPGDGVVYWPVLDYSDPDTGGTTRTVVAANSATVNAVRVVIDRVITHDDTRGLGDTSIQILAHDGATSLAVIGVGDGVADFLTKELEMVVFGGFSVLMPNVAGTPKTILSYRLITEDRR